jgi:DNA-directed RNA polymerase specialized sigma24 family protein
MLERVRQITVQYAATLSQRNGTIVAACWIDGRTARQLADELGLSKKCVESVLRRAKPKIRELLAPECVDRQ